MKKIYVLLASGEERFLGFADDLYHWFKHAEDKIVVPLHGHKDYTIVKNMFNPQHQQFVTYKSR